MKKDISLFVCPDCGAKLDFKNGEISCVGNHKFVFKDRIFDLLPHSINLITRGDAIYHNLIKEEWIQINQIDTLRNLYYHGKIIDYLYCNSNSETIILELGGGVGFDLGLFLDKKPIFKNYIFSEIHHEMALYVKNKISDNRIIYCLADATQLPIMSADIIFMIATLHHFPDWQAALAIICQKVSPGGYIICGIEPNRLWLNIFIKTKNFLKIIGLFKGKYNAPGDEQTEGFNIDDFIKFAALNNLKIEYLTPVWFFCGFLHIFVGYLFKTLKLKKRWRASLALEKLLIVIDQFLFKVQFMNKMSFHYTVIFKKPN